MRIKFRYLILAGLLVSGLSSNGQIENIQPVATPNAASIERYNQIPVDYFTGLPDIEIPLYTFKSRELSVPIGLSYRAGGIRPSDHASWVGLGWTLAAGGAITRVQNDLPDELLDFTIGTGNGYPRGFFYNSGYLANSGWASLDSLNNNRIYEEEQILNPSLASHYRLDYGPDEFRFNFLGMSGSLLMGQDGTWHLKDKQGLNFTVTTEIGPFAVWEPNKPNISGSTYPSLLHNCLARFILTGADGTQYYFGSDPATNMDGYAVSSNWGYFSTPDSNAVEFTRVGTGYSLSGAASCRDGGTVPTTWYLTKIKSVTGDSVIFRYSRDGYQIYTSTVAMGTYSSCSTCQTQFAEGASDNYSLMDGSTLSSITGANGTILFNKSKANILDYTSLGNFGSPLNAAWDGGSSGLFVAYNNEVFQGDDLADSAKSTFMELDSMQVTNGEGIHVQSFNFSYTSGPTQRLFLNSVLEKGGDGSTVMPYTFSYNNMNGLDSVPYNTMQVDHWGYLTDVDPFAGLFLPGYEPTTVNPFTKTGNAIYETSDDPSNYALYIFDSSFNAYYVANRQPVPATMQYGVLNQITYPTGGTTQFTWEPDSYSKYLQVSSNQLGLSVQDMGSTVTGGGLRIRQISSQGNFNSPPLVKTYSYVRDYIHGNNLTSGVLNSGLPRYIDSTTESGTLLYRSWTSNDVSPLRATTGSPVTYTTVTEVSSDSSSRVFTFSNQDNGYLDNGPPSIVTENYTSTGTLWAEQNMSSNGLARGLLLNEAWYNSGKTLIKNTACQYNSDTASPIREYNYQRQFTLIGIALSFDGDGFLTVSSGVPQYFGDLISPLSIYIGYPSLATKTETNYDQNGSNPVVKTTNFTYDNYRNKKTESFTSSQSELVSDTYNYAADSILGLSTGAEAAKTSMRGLSMYGIPLEKISTRSGIQTNHTRLDYQSLSNLNLIVPGNSYQASYGQPLDSATRYINYDNKGHIVQYRNRDGINTCTDWDYNQAYPTVKVQNAYNTLQNYSVLKDSTLSGTITWPANNFSEQQVTFTTNLAGTITLSGYFLSQPGSSVLYTFYYNLRNAANGNLCIGGSAANCGATPSSFSFPNMPAGTYGLTMTTSSSYQIGTEVIYTYPTVLNKPTSSGSKNYFYDGFENNTNSNVTGGTAHTGNLYWGASSYIASFVPPDNNTYTIEYWNLQSGSWVYNTGTYSQGMNLTGPVDDVRIFPANSLMSTYTWQPLVGMTSSIDPKGYTTYYTYDGLGRLATVLDKDRNVLKRYCYNLAGQAQSCAYIAPPAMVSVNSTNSLTGPVTIYFTNQSTGAVSIFTAPVGSAMIGTVPAGTYNVTMTPYFWAIGNSNLYKIYTYSQTFYATVTFYNISVSGGSCPITISSSN